MEEISSELTATLGVDKNEDGTLRLVALISNERARYENVVGNYEVADEGRRSHCLVWCHVTCSSTERRRNWGESHVTWLLCSDDYLRIEFGNLMGRMVRTGIGSVSRIEMRNAKHKVELTWTVCKRNDSVGKQLRGFLFTCMFGFLGSQWGIRLKETEVETDMRQIYFLATVYFFYPDFNFFLIIFYMMKCVITLLDNIIFLIY